MKKLSLLSLSLLIISSVCAQDAEIEFQKISYKKVFDKASKEKKPVFLYFHFDGCGACVKMEKSAFIDPQVAEFYNEKFVCLEVNTLKGEGIKTNEIYKVKMHPTFLYLSEEGEQVHKIVGVHSPEAFLQHAKFALSPGESLSDYKAEYEKGEVDASFLLEYCHKLSDAYELDSAMVGAYLSTLDEHEFEYDHNIRFLYEFAMINHKICVPFGSPAYNSMRRNRELSAQLFDSDQVNARILWIAYHTAYTAAENNDEELFEQALVVLRECETEKKPVYKEMDGRTTGMMSTPHLVTSLEMTYYQKNGPPEEYERARQEHVERIQEDPYALNELAWDYYLNKEDNDDLRLAQEWAERSIELEPAYANTDTYASLLFKLGDYQNAALQAEKAIEMAKEAGSDYSGTTELLKRIQNAMDE